jgi:hypothetical protein
MVMWVTPKGPNVEEQGHRKDVRLSQLEGLCMKPNLRLRQNLQLDRRRKINRVRKVDSAFDPRNRFQHYRGEQYLSRILFLGLIGHFCEESALFCHELILTAIRKKGVIDTFGGKGHHLPVFSMKSMKRATCDPEPVLVSVVLWIREGDLRCRVGKAGNGRPSGRSAIPWQRQASRA